MLYIHTSVQQKELPKHIQWNTGLSLLSLDVGYTSIVPYKERNYLNTFSGYWTESIVFSVCYASIVPATERNNETHSVDTGLSLLSLDNVIHPSSVQQKEYRNTFE
ncbi:hypothetical protein AVEN_2710-1 [Araneus ventricosus]|uniref:Uncharacterized protein n=1 Tax=Araneus ventricosus TaxID=182803 RepID=A0A4Y2X9S8_ARAVE|nr:hypothetical protein AVEN_2710-1 [Araneus ventricosus]